MSASSFPTVLKRQLVLAAGALALIGAVAATAVAVRTTDALDLPAAKTPLALKSTKLSVARAGNRLVAVGLRGHILVSEDAGATWRQIDSPVSTDLIAVRVTSDQVGWIVGHDAVLLLSQDGGQHWERRLDGRTAGQLMIDAYAARAQAGDAEAGRLLDEVKGAVEHSATPGVLPYPFLDVHFRTADEGFLIGAFGLLLHTADGGKTWQPWLERADNDKRFHLYAIAGDADQLVIAGEQGLLRRYDPAQQRFVTLASPYNGTFFGLNVKGSQVLAFGLRGNAFASDDEGQHWRKVETGIDTILVGALRTPDDRLLLIAQNGQVLQADAALTAFQPLPVQRGGDVFGAALASPDALVLARVNGMAVASLRGAAAR